MGDSMDKERIIFHVDVNNAFLSWTAVKLLEEGYETDIRNIPSVIGGDETKRHGIVLAKSPVAKKMGINDIKIDPKQMAHIEAIVLSMTPKERRNPDIIKASRKTRIASGSGTSVQEVNRLLQQFDQMKKMMKQMSNGNMKLPF